ncbi:MAG: diacylglycerol kinase family lipid kinase [Bacteroidetes bacterium]|nr:diacylglycerol kinase family lipid kinase [Bacteroidota bacterium]
MLTTKKKLLFILNPIAGGGKSLFIEQRINDLIDKNIFDYSIEFTKHAGHAKKIAENAVAKYFDIVTAIGGDGTINEIAEPLLHTNTALAIIPRGSGNGLARHMDIPLNVYHAIQKINRGSISKIDVIKINNAISVNVSGIGFDGWVANEFAKSSKRGFLNYAKLTLNGYKKFPQCQIKLIADGEETETISFITAIANSSQFGNNAFVAPLANIQDGLMDISIIRKPPALQLPMIFYLLFKKQIEKVVT